MTREIYDLCVSATGPCGRAFFPEQARFAQRLLDLADATPSA